MELEQRQKTLNHFNVEDDAAIEKLWLPEQRVL